MRSRAAEVQNAPFLPFRRPAELLAAVKTFVSASLPRAALTSDDKLIFGGALAVTNAAAAMRASPAAAHCLVVWGWSVELLAS